ncbi:MAG TPA: adenosylcobinamide-GDP ribazoletransferase [Actinomycetota bacterium]|nr:adenosylcobinamide-GDP ribazoletransferase [Actinomycetota bacterium]
MIARRTGPSEWVRLLGVATQFLTRVPVRVRFEPGDLHRAAGAFPLVGVLVAAIGVVVRWALQAHLGAPLATVAALAAMVLLTGAFHEDGLADTTDGLWGGRTPEERLRIMRDSCLGTYGTLALVLLFSVKLAALVPMDLAGFASTIVPAMVLGRASSLVLMHVIEPAANSLAALAGPPSPAGWIVAGFTCVASLAGFGAQAWLPVVATAGTTWGAVAIVRRKVGGINGDQLGAANQLVEVAVLVSGVVVFTAP